MDDRRRQRVLRQHVKTDQLMGVDAVPAGEAREGVRLEMEGAPDGPPSQRLSEPGGPPPGRGAASGTRRGDVLPPRGKSDRGRPGSDGGGGSAEPAGAERQPDLHATKLVPLDRDAKLRVLQQMDEGEVRGCTKCPLHEGRTQTVFGEGDPDAEILFIGEGPGSKEDELGRPFVGRAGELLDKMIVAMGLKRTDVFIANVVKCRPPNNRTPTPQEADICWNYLRRQIETIQPKVIVTLGGPAMKAILKTREGVTRLRGTWHTYDAVEPPIPVMPTFHPAYLLRSYTKENRTRVWSDLQAVMEKVGGS